MRVYKVMLTEEQIKWLQELITAQPDFADKHEEVLAITIVEALNDLEEVEG